MADLTVNTVIDTFMQATNKAGMRSAMDAAPLADPAFTGIPTAPTAAGGTDTTQLASTAFVQQELASKAYIDGEVTYYADLPVTIGTPPVSSVYLVKTWSVSNPFAFPGAWIRSGNSGALSDWTRMGNEADMFADAYFRIYDDSDSTKKLGFSIGGATAGKTVTITSAHTDNRAVALPDADCTLENTSHATKHESGGSDAIKLDNLAAPDDNTDLNASTTAHGLAPKVVAPASGLLSVLGVGNGETVRTDKALFDTTNPAALGVASPGTQIVAARRDHVHAMPTAADVGAATTSTKLDDFAATDDNTDLDATTSKHGLMPKTDKVKLDAGKRTFIAVLSSDDTYSGDDVSLTAAETTAQWEVGYINSSSKIALADADAVGTALGIYLATAAISADAAGVYLENGYARNDAWNWTPGGALYLSTTAGAMTQTAPSGTDDVVIILGVALTADIIRFKPTLNQATHTG